MRHVVVTLAVLAFAAGMILNWPGVAQLVMFYAAGGCGVPQREVLLGMGAAAAVAATLVAWRRWRTRRRPASRRGPRQRPAGKPAQRTARPRQQRAAARRNA